MTPPRSIVLLGFAAVTAGLIVAKAFGAAIDYELIILSATIAGLDTVRGVAVRAGVSAMEAIAKRKGGGK